MLPRFATKGSQWCDGGRVVQIYRGRGVSTSRERDVNEQRMCIAAISREAVLFLVPPVIFDVDA